MMWRCGLGSRSQLTWGEGGLFQCSELSPQGQGIVQSCKRVRKHASRRY